VRAYNPAGAGIAQLVEQLICNHQVAGSIPAAGTDFRQTVSRTMRACYAVAFGVFCITGILGSFAPYALAQEKEPPLTFEQAQTRTQFARTRMEAALHKVQGLERKEKAAYEDLTLRQKRYEEAKVTADSATEDLRAARLEFEESRKRYEEQAAHLRRIYQENEAKRRR
jgi:hypothetical protein